MVVPRNGHEKAYVVTVTLPSVSVKWIGWMRLSANQTEDLLPSIEVHCTSQPILIYRNANELCAKSELFHMWLRVRIGRLGETRRWRLLTMSQESSC